MRSTNNRLRAEIAASERVQTTLEKRIASLEKTIAKGKKSEEANRNEIEMQFIDRFNSTEDKRQEAIAERRKYEDLCKQQGIALTRLEQEKHV